MDLYEDITPAELTGYARQALWERAENQFLLSRWMPHRFVNDLVYRFNRGSTAGLLEAADYRAYDAEPSFGARDGITRITGELPPIGQQYVLGEYDQLRLRRADEEIRRLLLRDAARIARQIDTRLEIARGDAITYGRVELDEGGVVAEVDFGRSPENEVVASTPWDDPDAPILDDLEVWLQYYLDTNGANPGAVVTSRRIVRLFARNNQLRAQLYPNNPAVRLRTEDVNAVLEDFGLPPITIFDAKVRQRGVERRVIPEDRFILLPPAGDSDLPEGQLGATIWGTTLEAQEPQYGIGEADHPGMVVAAFKQSTTPIRVFTIGSAIGIPIMGNPNASFVATVLSDEPDPDPSP